MKTLLITMVASMLIPAIMVLFGYLFSRKAPGQINSLFGYRTTMSMKNRDTWEYSHRLCGRLWKTWGLCTLAVSVLALLAAAGWGEESVKSTAGIVCRVQLIPLFAVIPAVEYSLRKTFDRDGNRK